MKSLSSILFLITVSLQFIQCRIIFPNHDNLHHNHNTNKRGDSCIWGVSGALDYGRWASDGNVSTNHMSVLQPPYMPSHRQVSLKHHELNDQPVLAGEQHCPNVPGNEFDNTQPLMVTALCPWFWQLNYDPLRLPASLPEVHCRCTSAVTGHRMFACEEVTMRLRVLRFDSTCREYRPETMDIAVSCVSVIQPRLATAQLSGVRHHDTPGHAPEDVRR